MGLDLISASPAQRTRGCHVRQFVAGVAGPRLMHCASWERGCREICLSLIQSLWVHSLAIKNSKPERAPESISSVCWPAYTISLVGKLALEQWHGRGSGAGDKDRGVRLEAQRARQASLLNDSGSGEIAFHVKATGLLEDAVTQSGRPALAVQGSYHDIPCSDANAQLYSILTSLGYLSGHRIDPSLSTHEPATKSQRIMLRKTR